MRNKLKIWEAALATSAATTFFPAAEVAGSTFVDGGTRANNPIQYLWTEAGDCWGSIHPSLEENIGCLLSIGTGILRQEQFNDSNVFSLLGTIINVSTDTEVAYSEFMTNHPALYKGERYFRFNVDRGLESIGLEEYKKLPQLESVTRNYCQREEIRDRVESCAHRLSDRESRYIFA